MWNTKSKQTKNKINKLNRNKHIDTESTVVVTRGSCGGGVGEMDKRG